MKHSKNWVILAAITVIAGCASKSNPPVDSTAQSAPAAQPTQTNLPPESRIDGNIPADSPFSKIKIGMSQGQVHSILGQPTDTKMYQTGKAFIPFYFGNDVMRTEEYYKGLGRLTFTGIGVGGMNLKVFSGIYDASEDGFPND